MVDTGTSVQATPQTQTSQAAPVVDPARAELDQLMQRQFSGFTHQAETQNQQQTQAGEGGNEGVVQPDTPATPVDSFVPLKEKYGYENLEAAMKDIDELRTYKATPQAPGEVKYENEQSEKVAKALQAGKLEEVYAALHQQFSIDKLLSGDITKDNAEAIIKMGMQLKYKDLSPDEINFQYNESYILPEKPVMGELEDETEFNKRVSNWEAQVQRVEMKRTIDAKLLKPEIEAAKSKIIFPEIAPSVDEGYLQYKKSLEEQPQVEAAMKEIYKPFTPKHIETKLKFIDEPNNIDFEFQHEPDAQGFEKAKEMALDSSKFLALFTSPNGDFDNAKYLDALYFASNKELILMEAIKQAKNATIKASLPDNSGGTQRQFPQSQQLGELDQAMANAGIKRA